MRSVKVVYWEKQSPRNAQMAVRIRPSAQAGLAQWQSSMVVLASEATDERSIRSAGSKFCPASIAGDAPLL